MDEFLKNFSHYANSAKATTVLSHFGEISTFVHFLLVAKNWKNIYKGRNIGRKMVPSCFVLQISLHLEMLFGFFLQIDRRFYLRLEFFILSHQLLIKEGVFSIHLDLFFLFVNRFLHDLEGYFFFLSFKIIL